MKKTNKNGMANVNFNHNMWGVMDAFVITAKNENDMMNKAFPTGRFVTGQGSMRSNDQAGHSAWIVDTRIKLEDTYLKNTDWTLFTGFVGMMGQMTGGCASVGNVLRPFEMLVQKQGLPNGTFKRAVQLVAYMILENCDVDWSKQDNFVMNLETMDHAIDNDREGFWMRVAEKLIKWQNIK